MTVKIFDSKRNLVREKWFLYASNAEVWLNWQYPHRDTLGYTVEFDAD